MIEPLSNYYFDGIAFIRRSKWPKRIRNIISVVFLVVSLFIANDTAHSLWYKPYTDWKHDYIEFVKINNKEITHKEALDIVTSVLKWSKEFNVDEKLLLAVVKVESNFYIHAISSTGALGLMQVIPSWHKDKILQARKELGNPELFSINTNIWLGTKILKDCFNKTSNVDRALLCYSGQTPGYDGKVLAVYNTIKKL